ncbi:MAG: fimbria/pilus outer membrane usher protein, partial [Gammaproteobacteria bacterium]
MGCPRIAGSRHRAVGILAFAIALSAIGGNLFAGTAHATGASASVSFNRNMLSGNSARELDLARFEKGVEVLPGMYNVDLYLNKQWVGRLDVRFAAPNPDANAVPCLTAGMIKRMGLEIQAADAAAKLNRPGACLQLAALIPGAQMQFDQSDLRLDASVPQAALGDKPRGYVDPSSWTAGVPAFLLNYRFNAYHNANQGQGQTSAFLGLDSGLNLGLWRLRQRGTANWTSGQNGEPSQYSWQNIEVYARRALPGIKSELTLGDSYTDGAVFDSFALRGAQLGTDDRMRPQSRRGYAPLIRGVAATNAKVTVRQNGVVIYQTTVPPGPFVINDLYPTGYGGSLQVTVTEANGSRHSYAVPYASVAQLVRPGVTRFDLDAGQLRDLPYGSHPKVFQGAIQHGFGNRFTGYAGIQGAEGYAAALLGGAFNTRVGAFALDITEARAEVPGYGTHSGQSLRLTWSKLVPETRTAFSVAAYRYSTSGFLDLTEAAIAREYAGRGLDPFQYQPAPVSVNDTSFIPPGRLHQRNRFTLSLSQPLGQRGGSIYGNVSYSDYWNSGSSNTLFQLGYSNHFHGLSYGISVARTRDPVAGFVNAIHLNFSLPLGSGPGAPTFMANLNHDSQGNMQEQAAVNASLGQYNQFNWGATVSHDNDGGGTAASVNAGYRGSYAEFGASYGKGEGYSQAS